MNRIQIRNVILALAAIAAVLFLVATYGTALPSLPFASVPFNGPIASDSDGKMTAIADTESRRVLILNADSDLTGVVDCTTFDSPVEAVVDVRVSDELVYVAGVKYAPDSTDVQLERVAVYDKGGNLQGVAFEAEGSVLGNKIKCLAADDEGVVVGLVQYDDASAGLSFVFANLDTKREVANAKELQDIFDVAFSAKTDEFVVLSSRGLLNDNIVEGPAHAFPNRVFTAIDLSDSGVMYACDDVSGSICEVVGEEARDFATGSGYSGVHVNKEYVCFNNSDTNEVALSGTDGELLWSATSVAPSIGFSVRMLGVWVCAAYLAVLLLVLVVRKAYEAVKAGRVHAISPIFASAAVVLALGMAIGVLTYGSYQSALDKRLDEVNMCADYLSFKASELSDAMEKCDNRDDLRSNGEQLSEVTLALFEAVSDTASLVLSANNNGIGLYYTIYGKDDQGMFYLMGSSGEHVLGTRVPASLSDGVLGEAFATAGAYDDRTIHDGRALRDATRYRLVAIPSSDQKSVAGVIEVGSRVRALETSLAGDQVQRLFTLLVIMLVVYLAYSEIRACGDCLFTYRQLQKRRARDAVAALTRPFTLSITMLSSIDSVMTVLIARELLVKAGLDQSSPLLGLPAVMLGLGLIIGQFLYGLLGSKVGLRRLMGLGAVAMMACALITVAAVASGGFWWYCAAKLLMSMPFGLLYTLGYSMPRIAESDDARSAAASDVRRTDTSAAALGTVLGGYAAQALGNAWVYVIVAIACIPVIMMALNLLPKGAAPPERSGAATKAAGSLLKFVRGRNAVSLALFIVVPAAIAAGYTSFLFPLFSADLGLQKAEINNIYVLGQLIVYVCMNVIESVERRWGKWRASTVAMGLLGVVFLMFSLNTTLVWSIVVIAFVGLLYKTTESWKAMWQYSANEAGASAGPATSALFAVRSIALIIQPFILSALLGAIDSVAVIVIGAICVLCATLFFFFTRRTSLPAMR